MDDEPLPYFCDNHLLVANKPPGLLTQPSPFCRDSLEERLKAWIRRKFHKSGAVFLHSIHRIDRPVSGLVLFARTSKALSRLQEQSRRLAIRRTYIAEVEGRLARKEGRLEHLLSHSHHRAWVRSDLASHRGAHPSGKKASLRFTLIRTLLSTSLVHIELETGRYHQIRAQFSAIGHPIVGDRKYGAQSGDGSIIHLHADHLTFTHPVTHAPIELSSPAPFSVIYTERDSKIGL
jgi:23S rRNA pseudouridine1911/1915/1917 synthase